MDKTLGADTYQMKTRKSRPLKRCSIFVVREMQIKPSKRYHFTLGRKAKILRIEKSQGCGTLELSYITGGCVNGTLTLESCF